MEELTNRQVVLLCMFVSFVVSIATGIVTVAMLEEAPPTLTQTVNRVVERTIERVASPDATSNAQPPIMTVTKEVTVLAKEDDLVVAAVEKNQSRIVRIYDVGASTSSDPKAIGFIITRDGLIATADAKLSDAGVKLASAYTVVIGDNTYTAKPLENASAGSKVAYLKISEVPEGVSLDAVTFGSTAAPKVAQTMLVLGGSDGSAVFKTAISRTHYSKPESTATTSVPVVISLDTMPKIPEGNDGALVVNLDAQAVGIVLWSGAQSVYYIYPVGRVIDEVGGLGKTAPQAARSDGVPGVTVEQSS